MAALDSLLNRAWELSRSNFGYDITFYLPGMFIYDTMTGNYPAVSITGKRCTLHCEHCRGNLLASMIATPSPQELVKRCRHLAAAGAVGVLISGGCDSGGRLPWPDFIPAIAQIKESTGLHLSVHTGFIGKDEARALKVAGVDQALIDIVGCESTYERIFHLKNGSHRLRLALDAITGAGLDLVPHIVCGIDHGDFKGEDEALEILRDHPLQKLVIVSLMPIAGTGTATAQVDPQEVAAFIARARLRLPDTPISLGCARRRGDSELESLALQAGVNAMSLPSEEIIELARGKGLAVSFQKTCCSLAPTAATPAWS